MERVRKLRKMKQMFEDACIYVISFLSVSVFFVEILNWLIS
jgi:hypothetical protein